MKYKLGILGKDINYSLSPKIHKLFGEELNINLNYEIFDIEKDPIIFIENFFNNGGKGLNITKPYKEIVAQHYSKNQKRSFNTLSAYTDNFSKKKLIKGSSTDGQGFYEDLISKNIQINNKNVVLFGMGGAGMAIADEIGKDCNLFVWNRNTEKYNTFNFDRYKRLDELGDQQIDIVISCVSDIDDYLIELVNRLNLVKSSVMIDVNYDHSSNDAFLKISDSHNIKFYTGEGMLIEQAALSFSKWFGVSPSLKLKERIKNERL